MSGAGRIIDIQRRNEPKSNRPALLLVTDYDAPVGPDRLKRCAVFVPYKQPAPNVGDVITWGARHILWRGREIKKLGSECDPNDPHLWTG